MSKKDKKDKKAKKKDQSKVSMVVKPSEKQQPEANENDVKNRPIGHVEEFDERGYRAVYETLSNHTGFDVLNKKTFDHHGVVVGNTLALRLVGDDLHEFLSDYSREGGFYGTLPLIYEFRVVMAEADTFNSEYESLVKLRKDNNDDAYNITKSGIIELLQYMSDLDKARRDVYDRMMGQGDIMFDNLDLYFPKGSRVVLSVGDDLEGAIIKSSKVTMSWFGPKYEIEFVQYTSDGQKFGKATGILNIPHFDGKERVSNLPCRIITPQEESRLIRRGNTWVESVHSPQYLHFTGKMLIPSWMGDMPSNATGRCVIDLAMYRQENNTRSLRDMEVIDDGSYVPKDMYFTTPAVGYGFSLTTKRWGKFPILSLKQIDYRDDAYDLLVLDKDVKREVRALVENSEEMFTDLISGKGGGAIFLLHGPPGVGKTLTAESVAEILHRPLYSVSVGELGITPGEVEQSLRGILEMVTSWNAVLLLDEADIFLEARTKDDITRNAMVGVFLRLLEYHNGVLFLTTNRVQNFDDAFMSRISVIIQYQDFEPETRKIVWDNILYSAGLTEAGIDTEYMAVNYDINGRQIKNAIRIAMSLAHSDGVPCDQVYIERVVSRNVKVIDDIRRMDPESLAHFGIDTKLMAS